MKKKFSFVIIFFIAGIAVAVFISSNAVREAYRSRRIETEVTNLKNEANRIQNENEILKERIAYFQTPEFQEKIAKEKLNLQKPEENVVVIKRGIEQPVAVVADNSAEDEVKQDVPNYVKWWNSFFKYD
jgi:peptidoglycan hydrolase CwlO-like protein